MECPRGGDVIVLSIRAFARAPGWHSRRGGIDIRRVRHPRADPPGGISFMTPPPNAFHHPIRVFSLPAFAIQTNPRARASDTLPPSGAAGEKGMRSPTLPGRPLADEHQESPEAPVALADDVSKGTRGFGHLIS